MNTYTVITAGFKYNVVNKTTGAIISSFKSLQEARLVAKDLSKAYYINKPIA